MKNRLVKIACLTFSLVLTSSSISRAQTVYKGDKGFFISVLESFYLRGGTFESTQLIGPAIGYRFNETYDLSIHTELLFSENKILDGGDNSLSLLNLGIILGRTTEMSDSFLLRSELSLYKLINFDTRAPNYPAPTLNSILLSSSLYKSFPISNTVVLLPNIGGAIGYGVYTPPRVSPDLTQGFDGFIAGPKLGLDLLFRFSEAFHLAVQPTYHTRYNITMDKYEGFFILNFQLNF